MLEDLVPMAPPVPAPVAAELPEYDPIYFEHSGYEAMHVNFDRFSHESGNLRAFTYCPVHARGDHQCCLYVFVKDYDSREHAAAYLFAWRDLADKHPVVEDYELHVFNVL